MRPTQKTRASAGGQERKTDREENGMIYLGLDQTGAVDSKGRPRPLPACLIRGREATFFYLKALSRQELQSHLSAAELERLQVCVDCVLGLPDGISISWREALEATRGVEGYGRKPAQEFFRMLGKGLKPRRRVEVMVGANSVFQERPFQKNIQTGTFRIWKEIAQDLRSFRAPHVESSSENSGIPLFEGYPSLSWKILFQSATRAPRRLAEFLKTGSFEIMWTRSHQRAVEKDPNLADAFVLALTMKKLSRAARLQASCSEGWILGAPRNEISKVLLTLFFVATVFAIAPGLVGCQSRQIGPRTLSVEEMQRYNLNGVGYEIPICPTVFNEKKGAHDVTGPCESVDCDFRTNDGKPTTELLCRARRQPVK